MLARVQIVTEQDHCIDARALLDQESQLSFIRESLAQRLRVKHHRATVPLLGIGEKRAGFTHGVLHLKLRSRIEPSFEFTVQTYVLSQLTGQIPSTPTDSASWRHIKGLQLADPDFAWPGKFELILGAYIYGLLLRPMVLKRQANEPVAQQTAVGWIISGPVRMMRLSNINTNTATSLSVSLDNELHNMISQFWQQEEIPK